MGLVDFVKGTGLIFNSLSVVMDLHAGRLRLTDTALHPALRMFPRGEVYNHLDINSLTKKKFPTNLLITCPIDPRVQEHFHVFAKEVSKITDKTLVCPHCYEDMERPLKALFIDMILINNRGFFRREKIGLLGVFKMMEARYPDSDIAKLRIPVEALIRLKKYFGLTRRLANAQKALGEKIAPGFIWAKMIHDIFWTPSPKEPNCHAAVYETRRRLHILASLRLQEIKSNPAELIVMMGRGEIRTVFRLAETVEALERDNAKIFAAKDKEDEAGIVQYTQGLARDDTEFFLYHMLIGLLKLREDEIDHGLIGRVPVIHIIQYLQTRYDINIDTVRRMDSEIARKVKIVTREFIRLGRENGRGVRERRPSSRRSHRHGVYRDVRPEPVYNGHERGPFERLGRYYPSVEQALHNRRYNDEYRGHRDQHPSRAPSVRSRRSHEDRLGSDSELESSVDELDEILSDSEREGPAAPKEKEASQRHWVYEEKKKSRASKVPIWSQGAGEASGKAPLSEPMPAWRHALELSDE